MDQPTGAKAFFCLVSIVAREQTCLWAFKLKEPKGPFHAHRVRTSVCGLAIRWSVGAIFKRMHLFLSIWYLLLPFYQQYCNPWQLWIKIGPPALELNNAKLQACLRSVGSLAEIFGDWLLSKWVYELKSTLSQLSQRKKESSTITNRLSGEKQKSKLSCDCGWAEKALSQQFERAIPVTSISEALFQKSASQRMLPLSEDQCPRQVVVQAGQKKQEEPQTSPFWGLQLHQQPPDKHPSLTGAAPFFCLSQDSILKTSSVIRGKHDSSDAAPAQALWMMSIIWQQMTAAHLRAAPSDLTHPHLADPALSNANPPLFPHRQRNSSLNANCKLADRETSLKKDPWICRRKWPLICPRRGGTGTSWQHRDEDEAQLNGERRVGNASGDDRNFLNVSPHGGLKQKKWWDTLKWYFEKDDITKKAHCRTAAVICKIKRTLARLKVKVWKFPDRWCSCVGWFLWQPCKFASHTLRKRSSSPLWDSTVFLTVPDALRRRLQLRFSRSHPLPSVLPRTVISALQTRKLLLRLRRCHGTEMSFSLPAALTGLWS